MSWLVRGRHRWGVEIKRTTTPSVSPSIRVALADLKLDSLLVIHAGDATFPLGPRVTAVAWRELDHALAALDERKRRG